jgi:ATP adenylyltransferase
MEHIWAPWRIKYIDSADKTDGCFLCEKPKQDYDAENYILFRGKYYFVILNSYPYNPGHLLVAPYCHVSSPEVLNAEELAEHGAIINRCLGVLREVLSPAGFNLGMNLGRVAGAGLEDHIHTHVVPRWRGDANFMTVVADAKVIPEALADTYRKLVVKF